MGEFLFKFNFDIWDLNFLYVFRLISVIRHRKETYFEKIQPE